MSCEKIQTELSKTIAYSYYEPFIKPLTLYKIEENIITLIAPSVTIKTLIDKRYLNTIEEIAKKVTGQILKVEVKTTIQEFGLSKPKELKIEDYDSNGELAVVKNYLNSNYDIKYNLISEETVIRQKKETEFKVLNKRVLNSIYINIKTNKHYKHINRDSLVILLQSDFVKEFHPIKEYLEERKDLWDKKTDLVKELCSHAVFENDNMEFSEYLRKMAYRMIHTVYASPSERFANEYILILQSPEHYFKTTFLKGIFPIELENYINQDSRIQFDDKDVTIIASKMWVHVFDEIDQLFKNNHNAVALKDFLSNYAQEKRRAYGEFSRKFKKLSTFFGLTNEEKFLHPIKGNRRYLIFRLKKPISLKFQKVDINAMWSQLFNEYIELSKSRYTLMRALNFSPKQQAINKDNYLLHQIELNESQYIERYFEKLAQSEYSKDNPLHIWKTSLDIKEFLLNLHPKLNFYEGSIGKAMHRLGFYQNKNNSSRSYLIKLKDTKLLKKFEND
jgi:predicted P-loop ATPase